MTVVTLHYVDVRPVQSVRVRYGMYQTGVPAGSTVREVHEMLRLQWGMPAWHEVRVWFRGKSYDDPAMRIKHGDLVEFTLRPKP